MNNDNLYDVIYAACLKAAIELGPDIKKMSWFGSNHK